MTAPALVPAQDRVAEPTVTDPRGEVLWFLGTVVRPKLVGEQTAGRLAVWEAVLPFGAAPPLHSHPQDETFYVLDGEVTIWLVEPDAVANRQALATDTVRAEEVTAAVPSWVATHGRRCGVGAAAFAPSGTPHTFRVESDTARMLILSTPAGIEDMVRAVSEPARWPWLQPPPEGPRIQPERLAAIERELGMVRHGPPPPSADH
jgi:Cupin domain